MSHVTIIGTVNAKPETREELQKLLAAQVAPTRAEPGCITDPDGGRQAAEALRSLIGEIVVTPGAKRGEVDATLRGELFGILDFIKAEETQRPLGFMPVVEACPRNQFKHKTLEVLI